MGYRITVVDKIDTTQVSAEPIPYDYEIWLDNNLSKAPRSYKNTAQQHLPIRYTLFMCLIVCLSCAYSLL